MRLLLLGVEALILLMFLANFWVVALTQGRTYTRISRIPPQQTALVLGTSPKMMSGRANPYFTTRMSAAAKLYHFDKVRHIIVSGERSPNYNEPRAMKNYLIFNEGVPESVITEDPEGFNTERSIKRCKYVYGENDVIIVSQGFHNLRALFLARNLRMNAYAFDAQDIDRYESFYRNHFREFFARIKAVLFYVLNISPEVTVNGSA